MQHFPKSLFERQLPAAKRQPVKTLRAKSLPAESQRQLRFAPIDRALTWPQQQIEAQSSTMSGWLFAVVAFGALAGLGLIAGAGTMFIVVGALAVTFAILVACLAWTMDNTPFS